MSERQPWQAAGYGGQTSAFYGNPVMISPDGAASRGRPPGPLIVSAVIWFGLCAWSLYGATRTIVMYAGLSGLAIWAFTFPVINLAMIALRVMFAVLMLRGRRSGRTGLLALFIISVTLTFAGLVINWTSTRSFDNPPSLLVLLGGVPGVLIGYVLPWTLSIAAIVVSYARSSSAYLKASADAAVFAYSYPGIPLAPPTPHGQSVGTPPPGYGPASYRQPGQQHPPDPTHPGQ